MTESTDCAALEAAAARLRDAMLAGVPCEPVRDMPGLAAGPETGYAVQQINTDHWLTAGRRVSGHKVGLTNPAVQEQLGMDEPIWGSCTPTSAAPTATTSAEPV